MILQATVWQTSLLIGSTWTTLEEQRDTRVLECQWRICEKRQQWSSTTGVEIDAQNWSQVSCEMQHKLGRWNRRKTLWLGRARCKNVPSRAVCPSSSMQRAAMMGMETSTVERPRIQFVMPTSETLPHVQAGRSHCQQLWERNRRWLRLECERLHWMAGFCSRSAAVDY